MNIYPTTLNLDSNAHEKVFYTDSTLPFINTESHFDRYEQREWACHWHEEFEFSFLLKGSVEYVVYEGKQKIAVNRLNAGDCIFLNSEVLHSARALIPGSVVLDFVFPVAFFDGNAKNSVINKFTLPIIHSGTTHLLLRHNVKRDQPLITVITELGKINSNDECYELYCTELIYKLWRLLTQYIAGHSVANNEKSPNSRQNQRLKKVLSYIHMNFAQPLTVEEISKNIGISRSECFRCFQSVLGKTPNQYLSEYRLMMAKSLLANGKRQLADIALSCGFQNTSYFGKSFRKRFGITPQTYRKQLHK